MLQPCNIPLGFHGFPTPHALVPPKSLPRAGDLRLTTTVWALWHNHHTPLDFGGLDCRRQLNRRHFWREHHFACNLLCCLRFLVLSSRHRSKRKHPPTVVAPRLAGTPPRHLAVAGLRLLDDSHVLAAATRTLRAVASRQKATHWVLRCFDLADWAANQPPCGLACSCFTNSSTNLPEHVADIPASN
jgi:hypothetical protein